MNCQRFKPAEFKYLNPLGTQKENLFKGVPQVDVSRVVEVSETFHAPPANALSRELFVNYPPEDAAVVLDRVPRFRNAVQSSEKPVKPSNFECPYQEIDFESVSKGPIGSVKHPGQRMLG